MQIINIDKSVRSNTVQDSKIFNSQSLITQAKKRKTISFNDAGNEKSFGLIGWWCS